jgi:hypothetical protein
MSGTLRRSPVSVKIVQSPHVRDTFYSTCPTGLGASAQRCAFWHAHSTVCLPICGCRLDRPGKSHFNALRVPAGVELVHKIIKGQFALPRASARTSYMCGITCSPREGCTYLQQIRVKLRADRRELKTCSSASNSSQAWAYSSLKRAGASWRIPGFAPSHWAEIP